MTKIDKICESIDILKSRKDAISQEILELEKELEKLFVLPDEGSFTQEANFYKVTFQTGINRTIDMEKYQDVEMHIPETFELVRYKPELNIKEYRIIKDKFPVLYDLLAPCITAKPKKTAIKIIRKELSK